MAIMSKVPGVSVKIHIAGKKAKEYNDPDALANIPADIPVSSCYIESRSGAPFSIHFKVTDEYKKRSNENILVFRVYIDGAFIDGRTVCISKSDVPLRDQSVRSVRSYSSESGDIKEHDLVFVGVESVEEDSAERVIKDEKIARTLGLIEVKVSYGQRGGDSEEKLRPREFRDQISLAEKAMKGKALSHGTSFALGRTTTKPFKTVHVNAETSLCRFEFKYRSRDALRQELILPTGFETPAEETQSARGTSTRATSAPSGGIGQLKREHTGENTTEQTTRKTKKARHGSSGQRSAESQK